MLERRDGVWLRAVASGLRTQVLGVRRATVNEIAVKLQDGGHILYSQDHVRILNRQSLESRSPLLLNNSRRIRFACWADKRIAAPRHISSRGEDYRRSAENWRYWRRAQNSSGRALQTQTRAGQAISEMERVTQSTAATAEESASAAEQLTAQSKALQGIVEQLTSMVGATA